jgi:hypothetical protein
MKICYTVILGGYDKLREPEVITPGWKYVCITDTPEICEDSVYEAMQFFLYDDLNWGSKMEKWRVWDGIDFPDADYMVYHDGNFQVIGNLDEYIKPFQLKPFATRKHPSRTNVLDECSAAHKLGKLSNEDAGWFMGEYEDKHGQAGLYENGLLYFNQVAISQHPLYDVLFEFIVDRLECCNRDQLLLPMAIAETGAKPAIIDRNHAAKYFKYHKTHLK